MGLQAKIARFRRTEVPAGSRKREEIEEKGKKEERRPSTPKQPIERATGSQQKEMMKEGSQSEPEH